MNASFPYGPAPACQRWTRRRMSFRPAGELFNPDRHEVVLLKDTDGDTGQKIAEKIRQHIEEQEYAYNGHALNLTVSIGATTLQRDDTLHSLLSRADHAMYRAKQTGRNRTCVEMPHSTYA